MSLYLKYRPQDFNNLVWQNFIKETLQKAIIDNKIVWAYLLCWPRWTWKTSTARILAKTINCLNPINWNPCLKCEICIDFLDERLIDIVEIDAASHTWVDNIRDLIERAHFSPTKTKYKVYIIDEVHMLSKWAFNALLKILEEPPEHVKFILATTETHKVPDTIISRCQRYDFKRISSIDIKNRLEFIAKSEKIKIDKKSLEYIVNNSWGWLRNAISIFEQFISWDEIIFDEIVKNLWIVWNDILENFLEKLISNDNNIVNDFDELISKWRNIKLFFKELIFFIKNNAIEKIKKWENINQLIMILDILDETLSKTKFSMDENITFLVWILKIINSNQIINQTDISNNDIIIKSINKKNNDNIIKIEKKEIINEINNKENKNKIPNITKNDLNDIFSNSNNLENNNINNKISDDILYWINSTNKDFNINNIKNKDFDVNNFINELKKYWAKWALTMAIRASNINLLWNNLNILTKTKISRTQINNIDNTNLIKKVLTNMWILDANLNIT